ncbi:MAG: transglycosylase domain-containing protein [Hyphomicrobiales bacterium]
MQDPFINRKKPLPKLTYREVDAWLEAYIHAGLTSFGRFYRGVRRLFQKFKLRGFARTTNELVSEALTMGLVGLVFMLTLGLPAFEETKGNWKAQDEYSVTFFDQAGNLVGRRGILLDDAVPLEELPEHLVKSALATEDRRFFSHFGIDILGTARAMVENVRAGGVVQGGSSITQQLAKNLFLSNERTLQRKINEAFLALWLELNFTKREILKLYLDRAYMGAGTFGVGAAARHYFGKSVKDVTMAEAAMMAGLFKAPTSYAPHVNLPRSRARANEVLTNLVQAGFYTEGQVIAARQNPATPVDRSEEGFANFYLDWAFEEIKRIAPGPEQVLNVTLSYDPKLQKFATENVSTMLRENGDIKGVSQAALVTMENDGRVLAIVGGRDYGESQFNRATDALRQPGSSFKTFVYTAAMMNGFTPKSIVPDTPIRMGNWQPKNYNRKYAGRVTLTTALMKSINTVPIRLANKIGRQIIVDVARAMGLTTDLPISSPMPLGVSEVRVIDMAASYATLANGGFEARPYTVLKIEGTSGKTLYERDAQATPKRVLPEQAVADMNGILHLVTTRGTGRRSQVEGVSAAGKTGTTQAYRDAWFVGYTGNFTTAVWYGNDDYAPTNRLTGGNLPAMTWQQIMTLAHKGKPVLPMPGVDLPVAEALIAKAKALETPGSETTIAAADVDGEPSTRLSPATALALQRIHLLLGGEGIQVQVGSDDTAPEETPLTDTGADSAGLDDAFLSDQAG